MSIGATDQRQYMARAIQLAANGIYSTSPNPNVGCVIVDANGVIVGEGYHQLAGQAHAEIYALKQAGHKASGADVFVTLEPCAHQGRTGPCAEALVKAGVASVYIANADPNPLVKGKGIEILRKAGIEVFTGLLSDQAGVLNRGFFSRMQTHKPLVTIKLAASMDGKTALANGKSQWITQQSARTDVHKERAKSCAILTGSGTVLADNPKMTVRLTDDNMAIKAAYQSRSVPALRVVIDSKNKLNGDLHIFNKDAPTLVINQTYNSQLPGHVEQWQMGIENDVICLAKLLERLAKDKHVNNLWVEAGPSLCGALFEQSLVDCLILYQAPIFLGDKGKDLLIMKEIQDLQNAISAPILSFKRIGCDFKHEFRFK